MKRQLPKLELDDDGDGISDLDWSCRRFAPAISAVADLRYLARTAPERIDWAGLPGHMRKLALEACQPSPGELLN